MSRSYGPCVSKEKCIEILTKEVQDHIPPDMREEYERAANRLKYEFAKTDAVKPILYKGQRKQYDYWKCGNCGTGIHEIVANYCPNCGFAIKWDGIRCLTGTEGSDNSDRTGSD